MLFAMVINRLSDLWEWSSSRAQECGVLEGLDARAAAFAVECISSVIDRNATGQGLKWGDDWGWVLEMYGEPQLREIVAASTEASKRPKKRGR